MNHCRRCHACATRLQVLHDGTHWCPRCGRQRHYVAHGFSRSRWNDHSKCPIRLLIIASKEAQEVSA